MVITTHTNYRPESSPDYRQVAFVYGHVASSARRGSAVFVNQGLGLISAERTIAQVYNSATVKIIAPPPTDP